MNKFMNLQVLEAFRHGDRALLEKHPELETASNAWKRTRSGWRSVTIRHLGFFCCFV